MDLRLSSPITDIPRIGPTKAKYLQKLNITHARDFLFRFPRRYDDFSVITAIKDLQVGDTMTIRGRVKKVNTSWGFRGRRRLLRIFVQLEDDTGVLSVTWYNLRFLPKQLWVGRELYVAGKVEAAQQKVDPVEGGNATGGAVGGAPTRAEFRGAPRSGDTELKRGVGGIHRDRPRGISDSTISFRMRSPVLEFADAAEQTHTGRITPVYPETYGVTSRFLRYQVKNILPLIDSIPEYLPAGIRQRHDLMDIHQAIKAAHFPDDTEQLNEAQDRLRFDELFFLQLAALVRRQTRQQYTAPSITTSQKIITSFIKQFPYQLTGAQLSAIDDITNDLNKPVPMNRLIQGDVGSGKSAVALTATALTIKAGHQVFYLAPTEILARQQHTSFSQFLGANKTDLLIGSTKSRARQDIKQRLMSDDPFCLVGTHAIIQDDIAAKNLGLVIVDEQHRFGVKQRQALLRGSTQKNAQIDADNDNDFLYKELTYKIRGACFEVMNEMGPGLKESVYHKALEKALSEKAIKFEREKIIDVSFKGEKVGNFRPDLLIEDKIILELKALPFTGKTEEKQLWSYLKGSEYKLALLINFGSQKLDIKRVVYDTIRHKSDNRKTTSHLRKSAASGVSDNLRQSALQVRQSVPHLLSMTATPIPRTLNLTVFGDLDVSVIDQLPPGRQTIATTIIAPNKQEAVLLQVLERLHQGRQAYVIAPLVDQSDILQVKSARQTVDEMKKYFPGIAIELLHGKMPPDAKRSIMENFSAGAIQLLVATSVVEVGVDVPNATSMIIEGAERFGLSQLHQMRGRVGRGEHQSFCYLFPTTDEHLVNPRLQALAATNDGFSIAEQDLQLRGPGEMYGTDQSGFGHLQVASLLDYPLIKKTRGEAERLLKKDPGLKKYPILRKKVEQKNTVTHFE